jgi:hypothetical protein
MRYLSRGLLRLFLVCHWRQQTCTLAFASFFREKKGVVAFTLGFIEHPDAQVLIQYRPQLLDTLCFVTIQSPAPVSQGNARIVSESVGSVPAPSLRVQRWDGARVHC